jgi:hypothetical protein
MRKLRYFVLAAAAFGLMATPAFAQPVTTERCAIINYGQIETGQPVTVVVTLGTTNDQALVDQAASVCGNMIASGDWLAITNHGSPSQGGYVYLGTAEITPMVTADVWTTPDAVSTIAGYAVINSFKESGYPVFLN